jgi:hypothetical protein
MIEDKGVKTAIRQLGVSYIEAKSKSKSNACSFRDRRECLSCSRNPYFRSLAFLSL